MDVVAALESSPRIGAVSATVGGQVLTFSALGFSCLLVGPVTDRDMKASTVEGDEQPLGFQFVVRDEPASDGLAWSPHEIVLFVECALMVRAGVEGSLTVPESDAETGVSFGARVAVAARILKRRWGRALRPEVTEDRLTISLPPCVVDVEPCGDGGVARLLIGPRGWVLEVSGQLSATAIATCVAGVIDGVIVERFA